MTDAIRELTVRAEILHKRLRTGDPRVVPRLRALPRLRRCSEEDLRSLAKILQRRHCLSVVAAELGFASWREARQVLSGDGTAADFGTLLAPWRVGGHLNLWYARYEDARAVRARCQGYLLAYRRQYLVVDRHYVDALGLDPDDRDWAAIGFDWVRPLCAPARRRLYAKLVAALPRDAA